MNTLLVDTDACNDPTRFAPNNRLRVVEHRSMGLLPFNLDKVSLYLTPEQKRNERISGRRLLDRMDTLPVLNANYLDAWKFLCENAEDEELPRKDCFELLYPQCFRSNQKGHCLYTFFWGTVYENNKGRLFVRYACKTTGQKPYFGLVCLDDTNFRINCPAAVWT